MQLGPGIGMAPRHLLVELDTEDPTATLHELTSRALAEGWRLRELMVSRPTLEDVYLELTADA